MDKEESSEHILGSIEEYRKAIDISKTQNNALLAELLFEVLLRLDKIEKGMLKNG